MLVSDIDHFKKVNDTYGHDVGDVVIKGSATCSQRAKRDTDVVGRFGGEEFVVVCEETDEAGAQLLAERIREELERDDVPRRELGPLSVTCSVGVATFPEAGSDLGRALQGRGRGALRLQARRPQPRDGVEPAAPGRGVGLSARPGSLLGSRPRRCRPCSPSSRRTLPRRRRRPRRAVERAVGFVAAVLAVGRVVAYVVVRYALTAGLARKLIADGVARMTQFRTAALHGAAAEVPD